MPDVTAQATTFRTTRHQFRAFLSYLPQTVVFAASVNGTPTFPTQTVTVDNVTTGAIGDCQAGQTVEFFAAGVSIGKTRVAYGAGSGAVLQIAELSTGSINIQDNCTLRVYDEFRIWDKLVSATAALNKDSRIAYSDQGSNPPPVANAGGLWAGFLDTGQSYATVTFDASVSYVIDPDSAGTLTYLWDVGDGTITVGSDTDAAITVQFPAGTRHVKLTVTDSGNSKATVRWIPVLVHSRVSSSSDYPVSVLLDSRNYTSEGWACSFQLPVGTEASLSSLPDGALVVVWEDEQYGATNASYGSNVSGRSHIRFVGYLDNDQISIDADNDEVIFTALSPLGILAKTPALPHLTVQDAAPANWQEIKTNSVYRTLWYLWYWHTTLFSYFDFVRPVSTDLNYTRLATTVTSNALEQFRDIASALNLNATSDWLGRLIMDTEPQTEDSSARSSRTIAYDFTTADVVALEWERPHSGEVKTVVGEGVTDGSSAAANKAVYAKWPGRAPSWLGTSTETLSRQIVADQDDMNERTVLYGAMLNGLYNGQIVPKGLRLTLRGGYDVIDPALQEFVTLTLAAATNRRGVAFTSSTRWIVREAEVVYDPDLGSKEVVYTLDHETYADYADFDPADVTYVPPQTADLNLPDIVLPDLNFPGWDLGPITDYGDPLTQGTPTIAAFNLDGYVYLTSDFNTPSAAGGPTWTRTSLGIAEAPGSEPFSFVVDAFSPRYLGTGTEVNGWLIATTSTKRVIYRITDIFGSLGVTQQYTETGSLGAYQGVYLVAERSTQNFVIAEVQTAVAPGVYTYYTTDGTNWARTTPAANRAGSPAIGGIHASGHIALQAYVFGYATINVPRIYKTTDGGATWVDASGTPWTIFPTHLHVPFHNNPSDDLVYVGITTSNNSQTGAALYRGRLSTGVWADIAATTALYSGYTFTAYGLKGFASDPNNRLKMMMLGIAFYPFGGYVRVLFRTQDGGDNWEAVQDYGATPDYRALDISGGNSDHVYFWGGTKQLGFSADFGTTIDQRNGNIPTDFPLASTWLGLCGG